MNAKRLAKPALLLRLAAGAVLAMALAQPALANGELSVASEGARVAITDLDLAACEAVAAEAGPNAKAFALDVSDGEAIKAVVAVQPTLSLDLQLDDLPPPDKPRSSYGDVTVSGKGVAANEQDVEHIDLPDDDVAMWAWTEGASAADLQRLQSLRQSGLGVLSRHRDRRGAAAARRALAAGRRRTDAGGVAPDRRRRLVAAGADLAGAPPGQPLRGLGLSRLWQALPALYRIRRLLRGSPHP